MCNASVRVLSAGTVVILRARLNDQLRQRVGTVVRLSPQIIPRCRLAISKVIQHRTDDADDADARTEGTRAVVVRHRRVHAGAVVLRRGSVRLGQGEDDAQERTRARAER